MSLQPIMPLADQNVFQGGWTQNNFDAAHGPRPDSSQGLTEIASIASTATLPFWSAVYVHSVSDPEICSMTCETCGPCGAHLFLSNFYRGRGAGPSVSPDPLLRGT